MFLWCEYSAMLPFWGIFTPSDIGGAITFVGELQKNTTITLYIYDQQKNNSLNIFIRHGRRYAGTKGICKAPCRQCHAHTLFENGERQARAVSH